LLTPLVIGIDAGATATRCVVSTLDGIVKQRAVSGGANQNSSAGKPADHFAEVLSNVDLSDVAHTVIAAAGSAGAGRAKAEAAAAEAAARTGLTSPIEVVPDLQAAFAAGTPSPQGALLLSGTGAIGARFAQGSMVQRANGYGWLAADEGSAVWFGRMAVRAVFRALDGRGPKTALTDLLTDLLITPAASDEDRAQALVAETITAPPATIGRFAPHVSTAAANGDEVAEQIVREGVQELMLTLDTVAVEPPIVLAGGLLLSPGPIADAVVEQVRERYKEPRFARDGAAGAAALAIARHTGHPVTDDIHARLTGGR
jgi:glucosamine kinase